MGCVFPPMFNVSDDFNTQMMYAQMMNGGSASGAGGAPAGWTIPSAPQGGQVVQAADQGGGLFNGLKWGAVAGLGTAGATYFTNTSFTSPVVDGKFTDDFLKRFSGEYAAMQNGDNVTNYLKNLVPEGTSLNIDNYRGTMDSIDNFISTGNVAELTDEAKQLLKKNCGLADVTDDTLKALHSSNLAQVKTTLANSEVEVARLVNANNLNGTQALVDSLDDIGNSWKALGNGAESRVAKIAFLKENAHSLGISSDDYAKLLGKVDDIDVATLDDIFKRHGIDGLSARQTTLKNSVSTIKNSMQSFASRWKNTGLFGVGEFSGSKTSKITNALDDAYKAMKKSKAGKYGLVAAAVVGGLKLFDII